MSSLDLVLEKPEGDVPDVRISEFDQFLSAVDVDEVLLRNLAIFLLFHDLCKFERDVNFERLINQVDI